MYHLELIIIDSMQFKSAHFNIQNTFFSLLLLRTYGVRNESAIS